MILLVALAVGCGPSGSDSGGAASLDPICDDAPTVTWDGWANGFFRTYCTSCHSVLNTDHRLDAPEGVNFDTQADVIAWADRVRERVLVDADMPVGGGVYDDDLYLIEVYLECTLGQ